MAQTSIISHQAPANVQTMVLTIKTDLWGTNIYYYRYIGGDILDVSCLWASCSYTIGRHIGARYIEQT